MEDEDKLLIEKHIDNDEELKSYVEEHILYEKQLEELNKKPYLTQEEEVRKKKIKKLKLSGRDMIETILKKYR
jgi:hypothetical protein